ncbi:MAG: hypothetical protein HC910_21750 [Spirulinaceae cyanobacterium SM2_1_0]|nr:hypothetical protein [Spirulinaceae cyanobacterium SM2_1_0]
MLSATIKRKIQDCDAKLTRDLEPSQRAWIKGERAGLEQAYLLISEAEQMPLQMTNAAA